MARNRVGGRWQDEARVAVPAVGERHRGDRARARDGGGTGAMSLLSPTIVVVVRRLIGTHLSFLLDVAHFFVDVFILEV